MIILLLNACSPPNTRTVKAYPPPDLTQDSEPVSELRPEQESAFEALNTLQVSTDEMNRLYSTFAGAAQLCYRPDTSIILSQGALLTAMKEFVTRNCQNLPLAERDTLAATSVLAQEEYTVFLCYGNPDELSYENGAPRTGTWVLPKVLGRRDVVLVW